MRAVRAAVLIAAAVAAAAPATTAQAADCGDLGEAQPFAVFSETDYSASNLQISGRLAAGRDVAFPGSYGIGTDQLPQSTTRLDLIAGRNLTVSGQGSV